LHTSLTPRNNLISIGAAVLVATGTAVLPGPFPELAWMLGASFGLIAGVTQASALHEGPELFKAADTAVEVRRVLMSMRSGRIAVLAQWVFLVVLLAVALSGVVTIAGALGGYAVFVGVRDVVALKAIVDLSSGT
jgi:hypothetical protein